MSNAGNPQRQRGYSLLELTIVVSLLALIAAIAVPALTASEAQPLRLASTELAEAFRFARETARRTGVIHGVAVETGSNRVRVFRVDEAVSPNVAVFDVRHPSTKALYTLDFAASRYRGATLSAVAGTPTGACADASQLAIDADGVLRCVETLTSRIDNVSVTLSVGQRQEQVTVDTYTARVAVQ